MDICKDRISLVGNLNNPETLFSKGREEVRAEVYKNLDAGVQRAVGLPEDRCADAFPDDIANAEDGPMDSSFFHPLCS